MVDYIKLNPKILLGIVLLDPTELFNIINQTLIYPCISIPHYLLLIDCREKADYLRGHIFTAKHLSSNSVGVFKFPYDAKLDCKTNIVVYDHSTSSIYDPSLKGGDAIACAQCLYEDGSKNHVQILKGGYNQFTSIYHFLNEQKITYLPRELEDFKTYPCEVIPSLLYLGNISHASIPYILQDLRIKAHLNCTTEKSTFFNEIGECLMHICEEDSYQTMLYPKFLNVISFLDYHIDNGQAVLIYSTFGISRSVVFVLAYLMYLHNWHLQNALSFLKGQVTMRVCPNQNFIAQLELWEADLRTGIIKPKYSTSDDSLTPSIEKQFVDGKFSEDWKLFDLEEDSYKMRKTMGKKKVKKSVEIHA